MKVDEVGGRGTYSVIIPLPGRAELCMRLAGME